MDELLKEYWFYMLLFLLLLFLLLCGWIFWRRWLWHNIFGIALLGSISFSFSIIRINFLELFEFEFVNTPPHWIVTVTCGILHFLTVNPQLLNYHRRRNTESERATSHISLPQLPLGIIGKILEFPNYVESTSTPKIKLLGITLWRKSTE